MKFSVAAVSLVVTTLTSGILAHDPDARYAGNKRHLAWRRQHVTSSSTSSSASRTTVSSSHATSSISSTTSSGSTATTSSPTTVLSGSTTTPGTAVTTTTPSSTSTLDGNYIPPLSQITSGMPLQGTVNMFTTFSAGATPPVAGAPPLPSITVVPANYPALDVVPPTDSDQVKEWLNLLNGVTIPNIPTTGDGTCASNPSLVANGTSSGSCWWTCGGCTRSTDVSVCPNKGTWGVSYDDGPSPYTPHLINYLNEKSLIATFFVVGSRVISRPQMLQTEYMLGHQISVHTWSHHPLTTLTNEQIVAELGWTKKAIKDVLGVTPNTMRPPYGDIDDRVRAICKAMDLIPILWHVHLTSSGSTEFDTNDWKIPGGTATGDSSYTAFQQILSLAASLSTGFIVLEHDLYQQTVMMAIGYFLPLAFNQTSSLKLQPINECLGISLANVYEETNSNGTGTGGTGTASSHHSPTQGGQGGAADTAAPVPTKALVALFISFLMMMVGATLLG
ncbi:uncharacterized protein EI90DRAFT_2997168 [Cantharellus anzutake]|uniref:uncharacterized protein n=1 Tax=Cantharellus anzutake TaxID=1750568 RepID=UPI0019089C12|nr:uncharacterized protein EI90DRAFT_2997168 [Cantharellus anzutake]KAF8329453.1 hypothetical protein EI90DRAFT_2997168 [Cantharellus anzutake]